MRRRGVSLLELIFSLVIMFCVSFSILSILQTASGHSALVRDRAYMMMLAEKKMDELAGSSILQYAGQSGTFAGGDFTGPNQTSLGSTYSGYAYKIWITPDSKAGIGDDVAVANVQISSPLGRSVTLERPMWQHNVRGLAVGQTGGATYCVFVLLPNVGILNTSTGALTWMPPMPNGGIANGLCATPDLHLMWVGDVINNVVRVVQTPVTTPAWNGGTFSLPTGGMPTDLSWETNHLWAGDRSNHCFYKIGVNDGAGGDGLVWNWWGPLESTPPRPRLQEITSVASVDTSNWWGWACDARAMCIRTTQPWGNAFLTPSPTDKALSPGPTNLRPWPAGSMGMPRGIAADPTNLGVVYVQDHNHIWRFDANANDWEIVATMNPNITATGPVALALDPGWSPPSSMILWILTGQGQIWKCDITTSTPVFTQVH